MWCCLEMAGPESQSSSAGAAFKAFTRVEERCLDGSLVLAGSCIEMMMMMDD